MTAELLDLEPIKARLAAATPGRWVWLDHNLALEGAEEVFNLDGTPHTWSGRYAISGDAALIVNAPTDIAALIAEVERPRAQLTQLTP